MNKISLLVVQNPSEKDESFLRTNIMEFNEQFLNEQSSQFCVFAKNNRGDIIGGAIVREHSDALYIDILWIAEEFRKNTIGSQLINKVIEQAKIKHIKKIFVDTYAFQAVDFYLKNGFYIIATLKEYLLNHDRIYLRKDLSS